MSQDKHHVYPAPLQLAIYTVTIIQRHEQFVLTFQLIDADLSRPPL